MTKYPRKSLSKKVKFILFHNFSVSLALLLVGKEKTSCKKHMTEKSFKLDTSQEIQRQTEPKINLSTLYFLSGDLPPTKCHPLITHLAINSLVNGVIPSQ